MSTVAEGLKTIHAATIAITGIAAFAAGAGGAWAINAGRTSELEKRMDRAEIAIRAGGANKPDPKAETCAKLALNASTGYSSDQDKYERAMLNLGCPR